MGHDFSEKQYAEDYELKKVALEYVLGEMHNMVGHSIRPFDLGGSTDMYYFLKHINGTGFATMELLDPNGEGPKSNLLGTYELVAFTKESYNENGQLNTAFGAIQERICETFSVIARYSFDAVLNPFATCEVPTRGEGFKYIVLDQYRPDQKEFVIGIRKHHLLLCLEIFKVEMDFASANGGDVLIDKLKKFGHYPYSDLNRMPVI